MGLVGVGVRAGGGLSGLMAVGKTGGSIGRGDKCSDDKEAHSSRSYYMLAKQPIHDESIHAVQVGNT